MKNTLSKIYWPGDWKLHAAMKRANERAISRFKDHPYAVKLKDGHDHIQGKEKGDTPEAYTRPVL